MAICTHRSADHIVSVFLPMIPCWSREPAEIHGQWGTSLNVGPLSYPIWHLTYNPSCVLLIENRSKQQSMITALSTKHCLLYMSYLIYLSQQFYEGCTTIIPIFSDKKMDIQRHAVTCSSHTANESDLTFKFRSAIWVPNRYHSLAN